ncbi:MAG: ABC transporter permease [Polyangiaceae bacterium]|nr:ABC transporter permease [Polyangiaceae bacterium]
MAWKELIQLRRDRLTLGMAVALPVMQLLLFGYAINADVRHIRTVVYDEDQTAASRDLVRSLEATGTYDIVGNVRDHGEIETSFQSGDARVAIVVPARYAADLGAGRSPTVGLLVDGSDPQVVGSATSTASSLVAARGAELAAQRTPPIGIEPNILYNPDQRTALNIVPGLVGVILTMTMVMLTSMAVVRERERGTLEQLIVSPVRNAELVIGKILPYIAIGYLQMSLVLALGRFVFDVPILGSVPLLFGIAALFIAANLALGLSFSTIAKTQQQAMQMSMFFFLPNILLSGFMFPYESMPAPARVLGNILPLTHFLRIVRGIVLKGSALRHLYGEVIWLAAILAAFVLFASLRFKKKIT